MSEWEPLPNNATRSWRPPSDNTSYFAKQNEQAIEAARAEINEQVRKEANLAIHNIVTGKDAEINDLKEKIKDLESKLNVLKEKEETPVYEPAPPSGEVSNLTDFDIINNAIERAIKYGEVTDDKLNNERLIKNRDIIIKWKEFFEEYKWKSNYISVKIKKLLKDTNDIL